MSTTTITVETETLTIVRRARVTRAWCPRCHAEVETVAAALDAQALAPPAVNPARWAAETGVHCWASDDGRTRLCLRSLAHRLGTRALGELLGFDVR